MKRHVGFMLAAFSFIFILLLSGCSAAEKQTEKTSVSMGSVISVKVYSGSEEKNAEICESVTAEIERLDGVISKNTDGASLYEINHNAEVKKQLGGELYGYVYETYSIYSRSQGKASVTSGALTEAWGIDDGQFRVPSSSEISEAISLCSDSLISFDEENKAVTLSEGQILNLGSVGKGIACDRAAEIIKADGSINGAVVSVGGSIAAVGTHDGKSEWSVGVRNPFGDENDYFAVLTVGETFISTSGSYEKKFEENGVTYHHILDLTTGYPAENGLCSVTVAAPSGLVSDALSTMCFLLGEEESKSILSEYGAEAIFVYEDKTVSVTDGFKDALVIKDGSFTLV